MRCTRQHSSTTLYDSTGHCRHLQEMHDHRGQSHASSLTCQYASSEVVLSSKQFYKQPDQQAIMRRASITHQNKCHTSEPVLCCLFVRGCACITVMQVLIDRFTCLFSLEKSSVVCKLNRICILSDNSGQLIEL